MNAPARLGLYGGGLAALFAAAFLVAGAVVPEGSVAAWSTAAGTATAEEDAETMGMADANHQAGGSEPSTRGLSLAQDGLLLSPVTAPDELDDAGTLSFSITADGEAVTGFETEHDKELHLIVVRSDGALFRHVHPTMSADGIWSVPWTWDAAGSYRVFADFVPEATGESTTLSRTVNVAGRSTPQPATSVSTTAAAGGYTATLDGDLSASGDSLLTATVTKDGEPVTELEPYLGAYGHLVALRDGDLAYLHVHPQGGEAASGSVSGPDVTFMTEAPTPGRYLLYLDFKVDGAVHTAHFVLDATAGEARPGAGSPDPDHGH